LIYIIVCIEYILLFSDMSSVAHPPIEINIDSVRIVTTCWGSGNSKTIFENGLYWEEPTSFSGCCCGDIRAQGITGPCIVNLNVDRSIKLVNGKPFSNAK